MHIVADSGVQCILTFFYIFLYFLIGKRCHITKMKTRGRHPTGVLSHRTRRETRSESRSKSPQRRRKTTIAKNLTFAPSFLKVLPYTKSTTFSAKQVKGFQVPKSSHTCVNSVTPRPNGRFE
jgi:hypothetical protein